MTAAHDMGEIESAPRRERRVVGWPIGVVPAVFVLLSSWLTLSVMHVVGFYPSDTTRNVGVAEIISCERDPLHLWLIQHCESDVRWQGEATVDGWEETSTVVRARVTSNRDLEGQVSIIERLQGGTRYGDSYWTTVPLDYPVNNDKGLVFVFLLFVLGTGVAGIFVGLKVAHMLPEPPDRRRLTLRMAGLDERGQPHRTRTRARRGKKARRR